jgi:tetratricopeptide (TPR) repeat protein
MKSVVVMAAVVAILSGRVNPANADVAADCNQQADPALQISACTKIIDMWFIPTDQRASAYDNRGIGYFHQDKCDLAMQDYTRSISLNSNDALIYYNRMGCYFVDAKYDLALKDINAAINIFLDKEIRHWPSWAGGAQGSTDGNIVYISANLTEWYFYRGIIYEKLGQRLNAVKDFQESARRDPSFEEPRKELQRLGEAAPPKFDEMLKSLLHPDIPEFDQGKWLEKHPNSLSPMPRKLPVPE